MIRALLLLFLPTLLSAAVTEKQSAELGLVRIRALDATIREDVRYASTNNFLGVDVYGSHTNVWMVKAAAEKLTNAQRLLRQRMPGYSLLLFDGLRPRSVQYKMWDLVKGTDRQQYVANPATGSVHNFGAAIDLSIADKNGFELDMGAPFDHFGPKAEPNYEAFYLDPSKIKGAGLDLGVAAMIREEIKRLGVLTPAQFSNRLLLRAVMTNAGFLIQPNEWWHFNSFSKDEVRKRFQIVE